MSLACEEPCTVSEKHYVARRVKKFLGDKARVFLKVCSMSSCAPEDVIEMLKVFAEKLRGVLGSAEVYLFGSYARCDWFIDSDIDLIVVSDSFKGLDFGKRYALVRRLLPLDRGFEILTYTREEFEQAKKRSIVIQDASEYWIRIA